MAQVIAAQETAVSIPTMSLDAIVAAACRKHAVGEEQLASSSRNRKHAAIRAEIALSAIEQRAATLGEVARRFGRAQSGLSRAVGKLRREK
jgi:tellurite resistance protein